MGKRFRYHSKSTERLIYHSYVEKDFYTIRDLIVAHTNCYYTKVIYLVVAITTIAISNKALAYINLTIALYSVVLLLSLLITMAFLYELCNMPIESDYFLSFNNLLKVIYNAFIKYKFSFKILYKDVNRAQY
jgi:hypothetical protein